MSLLAAFSFICNTLLFLRAWAQTDFDWMTIEPTRNLSWVDCYSGFECTRLQVPIDYSNEDGDKAALAVIKLSAHSGAEYKGTVLMNPGGSGAGGIAYFASIGSLLGSIIGNQYDIISFNPRGIGNSTPRAEFFRSEEEHYRWLADPNHWALAVNATSDQIPQLWASAQVVAQLAEERDNGILDFISTDNIARDMLRITEAAGQSKLQYFGISYGTVIGTTFATMFPDKVERMLLDGALDVDAYYHGDWTYLVTDTEKAMQSFFDGCAAAGPHACAFYAPTAGEISRNLNTISESLLTAPIPVVLPSASSYGVVDYAALQNAIMTALAQPYAYFSLLAQGLAGLAAGNGTVIYEMQATVYDPSSVYDNSWEAGLAISCRDAMSQAESIADLYAYWDSVRGLSPFAFWLMIARIGCSGWKFRREERFTVGANTSYPILFVGNTADPITPLSAGKRTSSAFPGSVVLTQNASGHTTIVASSACTYAYIRAYFQNGTLPDNGIVCEVETELFSTSAYSPLRRSFRD